MNNVLYEELTEEERNEEEVLNTLGSSIALQMYYGNYTDGLNSLILLDVTALEFHEYLDGAYKEYINERFDAYPVGDCDWYDGMLTTKFFLELARDLETHKRGK